jgi:NTP pyrophosphatase (non-canonical NTP hydrolase)
MNKHIADANSYNSATSPYGSKKVNVYGRRDRESQQSTVEWAKDIWGVTSELRRGIAVLEEAAELALEMGLTPEQIHATVEVPILKAPKTSGPMDNWAEEAADVLLCLYALADRMGFDLHAALDKKMATNRSRPKSYYEGKQAAKLALGLPKGE